MIKRLLCVCLVACGWISVVGVLPLSAQTSSVTFSHDVLYNEAQAGQESAGTMSDVGFKVDIRDYYRICGELGSASPAATWQQQQLLNPLAVGIRDYKLCGELGSAIPRGMPQQQLFYANGDLLDLQYLQYLTEEIRYVQ